MLAIHVTNKKTVLKMCKSSHRTGGKKKKKISSPIEKQAEFFIILCKWPMNVGKNADEQQKPGNCEMKPQ